MTLEPIQRNIATIVDSCALVSLNPAALGNVYIPQFVVDENRSGAVRGNISGEFFGKALSALNKISDSSGITSDEYYQRIRSAIVPAYDCAGQERVLGIPWKAFADALSGLLYDLMRKKSITISCANKTKDKTKFRADVLEALKPVIERGALKNLGIEYREGTNGYMIITLVNKNTPENAAEDHYSFIDVRDFSAKFNAEQEITEARQRLAEMKKDRKYGSLVSSIETIEKLSKDGRVLKADSSETGRRISEYSKALQKYAPLLAKSIVQEIRIEGGFNREDYNDNKELIQAMTERVLDEYNIRLQNLGIKLERDVREAFEYNIIREMASAMGNCNGNGKKNDVRTDINVVASAYAVPEQNVRILSNDTDVIELALYAMLDSNLPAKKVSMRPTMELENSVLKYIQEREDARQQERKAA